MKSFSKSFFRCCDKWQPLTVKIEVYEWWPLLTRRKQCYEKEQQNKNNSINLNSTTIDPIFLQSNPIIYFFESEFILDFNILWWYPCNTLEAASKPPKRSTISIDSKEYVHRISLPNLNQAFNIMPILLMRLSPHKHWYCASSGYWQSLFSSSPST